MLTLIACAYTYGDWAKNNEKNERVKENPAMENPLSRTEMIFGKDGMEKLSKARIAVFGLGGVGGYVMEALARSGIGALDLIDGDRICLTNINRQILATRKTVGRYKVDVAKERVLDINPGIKVNAFNVFYSAETSGLFNFAVYDYVVDAIDTVPSKVELVVRAKMANVPIISSMGAGNKVDPTAFEVADIFCTSVCPLARVMRRELRSRGIKSLKVVYSKEQPVIMHTDVDTGNMGIGSGSDCTGVTASNKDMAAGCCPDCTYTCNPDCRHVSNPGQEWSTKPKYAGRRHVPGSNSFVPPVAGLIIASEVIKDLIGYK